MVKDVGWKVFFSDDERYADIINGIGCGGEQVVKKEDLHEMDTQVWFLRGTRLGQKISAWKRGSVRVRDAVRKVAFGMNFAIIGVENQDNLDYSIPIKSMSYDVGTYEKQAAKIRREVRKNRENLSVGEYLYGFRKDSRLYPVATFILYSGVEEWSGPMSLHEILDFTGLPKKLRDMVADYKINLIDIRKLKATSIFQTDVRQVFDFIRCANDGRALKELVENDDYYKNMDEEAFDVAVQYTQARELIEAKEYYVREGGVNMCQALQELIAEGHAEGQAKERENTERERRRADLAEAQAKEAEAQAKEAEAQAKEAEAQAKAAETENARLREELARLKAQQR